jgi:hypothetical protein
MLRPFLEQHSTDFDPRVPLSGAGWSRWNCPHNGRNGIFCGGLRRFVQHKKSDLVLRDIDVAATRPSALLLRRIFPIECGQKISRATNL